jgi:Right handed beta helix region
MLACALGLAPFACTGQIGEAGDTNLGGGSGGEAGSGSGGATSTPAGAGAPGAGGSSGNNPSTDAATGDDASADIDNEANAGGGPPDSDDATAGNAGYVGEDAASELPPTDGSSGGASELDASARADATAGSTGSGGSGGAAGSGGATGSGGAAGSGGATGSGGAAGSGGAVGSGGAAGSGGTAGSGGAAGSSDAGTGGSAGGSVGPCTSNALQACTCAAPAIGSRRCLPDGSEWTTCSCATYGAQFAVSTTGNDANPGTLAQPFATLERARDAVRTKAASGIPTGGIVVWIRGGIYERAATLTLGSSDSGRSGAPIVWRGYPGETVRLVGGRRLASSWFQPVTSAAPVWSRLDPSAQGKVVSVDLKAHGITDFGTLQVRGMSIDKDGALELFADGVRQELARWPDASETDKKSGFITTADPLATTSFGYAGDRPKRWTSAPEIWVHGLWGNLFGDEHLRVTSIDTTAHTMTVNQAPNYAFKTGQPFYAYNLLEEITVPGEWYVDRTSGTLYVWPTRDPASTEFVVSMLATQLVDLNGASYVTIRDLTLEASRSDLARIRGGSHDTLEGLTLRNAGGKGATIDGSGHTMRQCHIHDVGEGGVSVTGGDRASLAAGGHLVESCHFERFERWVWTYQPAIYLHGVGNVARHNLIHDAPHTGILFNGNDHTIELNELHHLCDTTNDAGAIYSGRDWGARGNVLRNNFIHDIADWQAQTGVHGFYLDDTLAGPRVEGNVIYKVAGAGIRHGGGRDVVMVNNVIVKCGRAISTDARGPRIYQKYPLLQNLIDLGYQQEPWKSRYPECAAIPNVLSALPPPATWLYPEGAIFSRNIGYQNGTWVSAADNATQYFAEIANDVSNQDPLFVDEATLNLALRPESPALKIPGFQAIPFGNIGIAP